MSIRMLSRWAAVGSVSLLLSGCSGAIDDTKFPEANAENCKDENILKIRDKAAREAFASRCFRSGKFEPSPNRTW